MKKLALVATVLIAATFGLLESGLIVTRPASRSDSVSAGDETLAKAFANRRSSVQVEDKGIVAAVLADDNDGSRHQRFIIELESGQTLLIAHNIDLADRINALKKGDRVEFYGEYEWNPRGGVIHWTYHDPAGCHLSGWIEHDGRIYH